MPRAIAVGAPVATGVHTGFQVHVVATLRTCRDSVVSYRVALVAPKQLSRRARRALRSKGARLALAVNGDGVSDARFDAGTGSVPAAVEVTGGKRAITVLSGRVDRRPDDHDTVEFLFAAPWHSPRSGPPLVGQSCWVQLPAIVGSDALDFADDLERTEGRVWHAVTVSAEREPPGLVESTIATRGSTTLIVGGRILASDSVPTPDRLLPSGAQFECRGEPRRFGIRQTNDESVPELPLVGRARIDYEEASPPAFAGCGASVGVADPSADVVADFLLVLAGALLGFAIHQVPRRRIGS